MSLFSDRFGSPVKPMTRLSFACLLLTSILLGAACSRGRPGEPGPAPWLPLAPEGHLYTDNAGGIRDSLRTVVRDESALRLFWQQATAGQSTPPPLPTVDFARDMVLVVAAGRMSPEDEIRVDSVLVGRETDANGRREPVMSALVRTVEGCGRFTAPAYPVQIVRVRRFEGRVRFVERRDKAECPQGGSTERTAPAIP
jgi:hypothetical protein